MPRLFFTDLDRKFTEGVRQELDANIVQQEVLYYKINMQKSQVDEVYGEITKKAYDNPVSFYTRLLWQEPEVVFRGGFQDTIYRVECYCNTKELEDRGIVAKAGDVIESTGEFYEIEKVVLTKPQMGQQDDKIETSLYCRSCRENYFVAPEHPLSVPKSNYSGSGNTDKPTTENYGTKELVFPK